MKKIICIMVFVPLFVFGQEIDFMSDTFLVTYNSELEQESEDLRTINSALSNLFFRLQTVLGDNKDFKLFMPGDFEPYCSCETCTSVLTRMFMIIRQEHSFLISYVSDLNEEHQPDSWTTLTLVWDPEHLAYASSIEKNFFNKNIFVTDFLTQQKLETFFPQVQASRWIYTMSRLDVILERVNYFLGQIYNNQVSSLD